MAFKDYYFSLPEKERVEIRELILQETEIGIATFYNWLRNDKFPKVYRIVICMLLEKEMEELF